MHITAFPLTNSVDEDIVVWSASPCQEGAVSSRHFRRSYLNANKVSKSEGTRKVECAYNFYSALMLFSQNYQN